MTELSAQLPSAQGSSPQVPSAQVPSAGRRVPARPARPAPATRRRAGASGPARRAAGARTVRVSAGCRVRRDAPRPLVAAGRSAGDMPRQSDAPPVAERRRQSSVLRLTRRGRVVLLLVISALLLGAFSVGRVSSSAAPRATQHRVVVAHQGDTLWSIATRVAPGVDPRDEVARIADANHLRTSDVRAGQQLVIPSD